MRYREILRSGTPLPRFDEVEFSSYSQNGEDGILLLIFTVIGTTNKRAVEICAGDGVECNSANLVINHGWDALLVDGDQTLIDRGRAFYAQRTNAWRLRRLPPKLVHAWVTRDNVNALLKEHSFEGPIDLLTLDLDGMDYWVWNAIDAIAPRVVVAEYNNRWPADQAITVPYADEFRAIGANPDGEGYFGASLRALTILAQAKGYRLVGANSPNTNAFFMREGSGEAHFPAVTVESCLSSAYARHQFRTKYPLLKGRPIVDVSGAGKS